MEPDPPSTLSRLGGTATLGKVVAIVTFSTSLILGYFFNLSPYFTLSGSGMSLGRIWTLFTWFAFDPSVLNCVLDTITLILLTNQVEPAWGQREMLFFMSIMVLTVGVSMVMLIYITYGIFGIHSILESRIGGVEGIIGGLVIALTQLQPETSLSLPFGLSFRVKNIPALMLAIALVDCLVTRSLQHIPVLVLGMLCGWIYLRFFQSKPEGRGDHSDLFALSTFFPEWVLRGVNNLRVRAGLQPQSYRSQSTPILPSSQGGVYSSATGVPPNEMERRRLLGQRTLDRVLSTANSFTTPPSPVTLSASSYPSQITSTLSDSTTTLGNTLAVPPLPSSKLKESPKLEEFRGL